MENFYHLCFSCALDDGRVLYLQIVRVAECVTLVLDLWEDARLLAGKRLIFTATVH